MKQAIFEITAGSIALLIFNSNAKSGEDIILKEKKPFSLVSYIAGGQISSRGTEKMIQTIEKLQLLCAIHGVAKTYALIRNFSKEVDNLNDVLAQIKKECNLEFIKLTGKNAAYYVSLSASDFFNKEGLVLIDTGSCDTQVVDMESGEDGFKKSLKLGSMRLSNRYIKNIFPSKKEIDRIIDAINKKIEGKFFDKSFRAALLVGSVSYTIAQMVAEYFHVKMDKNISFSRKKFSEFLRYFFRHSHRSALVLRYAPERLTTIASSLLILKRILKKLKVETFSIKAEGLLEGYMAAIKDKKRLIDKQEEDEEDSVEDNIKENAAKVTKRKRRTKKEMQESLKVLPMAEIDILPEIFIETVCRTADNIKLPLSLRNVKNAQKDTNDIKKVQTIQLPELLDVEETAIEESLLMDIGTSDEIAKIAEEVREN